ncbi:MAG: D-glycero-alpha-D-manno-heptose-1,7-bisphosphate 7-phosphatase [Nitrospiraceae bacterium]
MARAVFLDRDGVLNDVVLRNGKPHAPFTLAEFRLLPGVPDALRELNRAGFLLIVVTNQPDVARGSVSREVVESMHQRLRSELPLDDIKTCYEIENPGSRCYKPKPGMLLEAAQERAIDLSKSYMVGDRWRDIGCGRAAGCFTILIDRGYNEMLRDIPDATCRDLREAASLILSHANSSVERRSRS